MTRRFEIKKGLDVPIAGAPRQVVERSPNVTKVGLVAEDYLGMKPTMEVAEGDRVKLGQLLFTDKKTEGVRYTSPGAGTVSAVNRGAKRAFLSIEIELDGDGLGEWETFPSFSDQNLAQLPYEAVRDALVQSGLWTTFQTRPFSKVPAIDSRPHAIFVTAIDTNPLAADPKVAIDRRPAEFTAGLQAISVLTEGETYLCKAPGVELPGEDLGCIEVAEFAGPHPAGLAGTHIHLLAPASFDRPVWHIGYQDVIAIGHQMLTGELLVERIAAVSGPIASNPRLISTRIGASLTQLVEGEANPGEGKTVRVVSGSVLSGRRSLDPVAFLGRRHNQVSLLEEGNHRDLLGWLGPGLNRYSTIKAFVSGWLSGPGRKWKFTTSTEGSHRAIVPLGMYEKVMPLDIIPTPLLKALCVQDTDTAQQLGCLELDEEDLGLCTFVCPGKNDYGPMLRESLTTIEKDG
ncbi:MAG: Na(+)-translocating NADH-quinone reductase subunit A [Planctomycetota bacterium]